MCEQQNMAVIRAWVEAINRNDVDAELACWAPDGEYVVIPTGSTYRGVEQIRNAGHRSAALVGDQPAHGRKQITHLEAGNDWACVSYDAHATITGPLILDGVTVIPKGVDRTIVTKACVVFEMSDAKITRGTEYFDKAAMAQQLGIDQPVLERLYSSLGSTSRGDFPRGPSTPAEVVTAFLAAWNNRDLDALGALLAPQVSGRNPLSSNDTTLSRPAAQSAIGQMMVAFPDLHMRIDSIVSDGVIVAVEEFETATLAATGRSYAMPVSLFVRVNPAGQIDRFHNYWDTRSYFGQLKITPKALSQLLTHSNGGNDAA